MKYFGCAYYPESTPEEQWENDFRMMREIGINLIRIGEFNWGKFEPDEGVLDFAPYHRVLDLALRYGIHVMMCTPSAAVPQWMMRKYPETQKMHLDGQHPVNTLRRTYCPTSEKYRFFVRRIVRKMAEEFKDHPAVVIWQLDNEIIISEGTEICCCPQCVSRFQAEMAKKYHTPEEWNRRQNGSFWSADIHDWRELDPRGSADTPQGKKIPFYFRRSWAREYSQFQSDMHIEFLMEQYQILKEANPSWILTSNNPFYFGSDTRVDQMFRKQGYAACDTYVEHSLSLNLCRSMWDLYRNITGTLKPFMTAETGAYGSAAVSYSHAMLKPWFWDMIARGAESIVYFRWRKSVMGEEEISSILPWSGVPGEAYETLRKIRREYLALPEPIADIPLKRSRVAVVYDHSTGLWEKLRKEWYAGGGARCFQIALSRRGLQPDLIPLADDMPLEEYELLVMPVCQYLSPALTERLKNYVKNGGKLIAMTRLNCQTEDAVYRDVPYPFGLTELFGMEVVDFRRFAKISSVDSDYFFKEEPIPSGKVNLNLFGENCPTEIMVEKIRPGSCEILEKFDDTVFRGNPCITQNRFGKGLAIYLGAYFGPEGIDHLTGHLLELCGIRTEKLYPPEITHIQRGDYTIIVNPMPRESVIPLEEGVPVMGEKTIRDQNIVLAPFEVLILKTT